MSGEHQLDNQVATQPACDNNVMQTCIESVRNAMTPQAYNDCLQKSGCDTSGVLPSLDILHNKADVPPPPELKLPGTSDKDLAADGIKREHVKEANGGERTSTEFPNGVKVFTAPGGEMTLDNGHKVTLMPSIGISSEKGAHEHPKGSGNYFDSHGKEMWTANKDGSYTVYTDGGAYTAKDDGTVTKEGALKNRDGTWTVIDTKDPLGGLTLDDPFASVKKAWLDTTIGDPGFTLPGGKPLLEDPGFKLPQIGDPAKLDPGFMPWSEKH